MPKKRRRKVLQLSVADETRMTLEFLAERWGLPMSRVLDQIIAGRIEVSDQTVPHAWARRWEASQQDGD